MIAHFAAEMPVPQLSRMHFIDKAHLLAAYISFEADDIYRAELTISAISLACCSIDILR